MNIIPKSNSVRSISRLFCAVISVLPLRQSSVKGALGEISFDEAIDTVVMSEALAGKTIKFDALFKDPALKESEEKTLCLRGDIEEKYDSYAEILGERIEIVTVMKAVSTLQGWRRYSAEINT